MVVLIQAPNPQSDSPAGQPPGLLEPVGGSVEQLVTATSETNTETQKMTAFIPVSLRLAFDEGAPIIGGRLVDVGAHQGCTR